MSDATQSTTETTTPNYETDKLYKSLVKKVQQLFKKYKFVNTIEENYKNP